MIATDRSETSNSCIVKMYVKHIYIYTYVHTYIHILVIVV